MSKSSLAERYALALIDIGDRLSPHGLQLSWGDRLLLCGLFAGDMLLGVTSIAKGN